MSDGPQRSNVVPLRPRVAMGPRPDADAAAASSEAPALRPTASQAEAPDPPTCEAARAEATPDAPHRALARKPGLRWLAHPAHLISLGFGSGLAPAAPGTFGTLGAWLAWNLLMPARAMHAGPLAWALVIVGATVVGTVACTITARAIGRADPGCIVWDEWIGFGLVLAVLMPADWRWQLAAFGLFRAFDAAKPGPVGWTDRAFKTRGDVRIGWVQGFGILADDLVAGACTLLTLAVIARLLAPFT